MCADQNSFHGVSHLINYQLRNKSNAKASNFTGNLNWAHEWMRISHSNLAENGVKESDKNLSLIHI